MKKYFKIIPLILLFSCISDKDRFNILKKEYPNCEILSRLDTYYAVDTTSLHGAIYHISFYPNNTISKVDRIR
jgi:hypothetical protein